MIVEGELENRGAVEKEKEGTQIQEKVTKKRSEHREKRK